MALFSPQCCTEPFPIYNLTILHMKALGQTSVQSVSLCHNYWDISWHVQSFTYIVVLQDRQGTLTRFRTTIVAVENNKYEIFWACVCSRRYPSCNAHAPYFPLWPVQLYNIFPHYLINSTILEKRMNIKCVFWFALTTLSETFIIVRRTETDMTKNLHWFSCKVPVILARV